MNVETKLKYFAEKKSCSVFEGVPIKPFEHTMTFFPQSVLKKNSTFINNAFYINSRFFHNKMNIIKKKKKLFSKVYSYVGESALFWRDP